MQSEVEETTTAMTPTTQTPSSISSSEEDPFHHLHTATSTESVQTWLQRITHKKTETTSGVERKRILTYEDLPYMGEMTLDNSKPRRGRKPKKADICHLIYKNYGTVLPGAPAERKVSSSSSSTSSLKREDCTASPKGNVQNKISSLLEKRLTQETRKRNEIDQDEPLNLCIKDLHQLQIHLMSKSCDFIKAEPQSDDEVEFVNESSSMSSQDTDPRLLTPGFTDTPPDGNGYVYWPGAGVFIHPMALQQQLMYYQRLTNSNFTLPPPLTPKPSDQPYTQTKPIPELRKIAPKTRTRKDEDGNGEKTKRNAPTTSTEKTPTKRKRSAIFIPPIPAENQTNPATEVSICKFKFTGGAKPTLQEKKMLSVDSGGNFRYYSGTGDKSMRGYEFFPRETLQQQVGNAHGSSTGAFLQASGERIYPTPVDFTGKQHHPELLLPAVETPSASSTETTSSRHKKRKTRKSLQRERLEQTFKEKGFLIQTQQLESAEGATYCKFRQLRKFTRYLFRSWKDYLPGNVRDLQDGEEADGVVDHELARFAAAHTNNFDTT